jgi:uncharacterized protein
MSPNVGVNVIEVDGRASPAIAAAPTSVAAFVGLTERGPADQPVRLTNLAQFRDRFGNHRSDGFIAYALEGFFLNGGTTAYVSRVVGTGSVPASTTLDNRQTPSAGPALRVSAGYRGQPDPGDWGERLRIDVVDDPRGRTQLAADTATDATSAQLVALHGFQVGSVVRFADGDAMFHRKVTAVDASTGTISWADAIPSALHQATATVTTAEFRLTVRYQASPTADFAVVETWPTLSMEADSVDYAVGLVNHQFTGSRHILLTDLSGTAPSADENPAVGSNKALSKGTEKTPGAGDFVGDAAARTGLHAFDTIQAQLLAIPDAHGLAAGPRDIVVRGALDYCAARGDAMFVGSAPDRGRRSGVTVPRAVSDYAQTESDYLSTVQSYSAAFQAAKVYGALYSPWVRVADPISAGPAPARFIPGDGHVMGVYARTELERGIWKAPAGLAAQLRGALDVAARFTDEQHTDLVRNGFVNGVRPVRGAGIVVAASRTLSTDTRWWFVNVRLLFNFVKTSLRDGLRFVRQEPHTEQLRRTVRLNVVTPFLMGLWRQGAFGSDPAEQTFTVKCDAENNPPTEVDLGNFRLEVYFYPVRLAEMVLLVVGQQPSGGSATEA